MSRTIFENIEKQIKEKHGHNLKDLRNALAGLIENIEDKRTKLLSEAEALKEYSEKLLAENLLQ